MEKWETHLPQQAGEEGKTEPAHAPAEVPNMPEEKEIGLNPRIQALKAARDEADRKLQEAILDLETREQLPAFQKAKELFDSGMRLRHFSNSETEYYIFGPADLVSADTYPTEDLVRYEYTTAYHAHQDEEGERGNVYAVMGIEAREDRDEILKQFVHLTQEAR